MRRKNKSPAEEAIDDIWQRRAMAAAVLAVRRAFQEGGIPPGTAVSQLNDIELGWIVASAVFAWIRNRSEQAASQGRNTEAALRPTGLDPEPWCAGAVAHILPELGALPDLAWSKPIGAWPKDDVIYLLLQAVKLTREAMIARDVGSGDGGVSSPGSLDGATAPPASSGLPLARQAKRPPASL